MRTVFRIAICGLWVIFFSCASDDSESAVFGCGEGQVFDCADCQEIDAPVCGCDDVTYQNSCKANCNGVYEYTQGACP